MILMIYNLSESALNVIVLGFENESWKCSIILEWNLNTNVRLDEDGAWIDEIRDFRDMRIFTNIEGGVSWDVLGTEATSDAEEIMEYGTSREWYLLHFVLLTYYLFW